MNGTISNWFLIKNPAPTETHSAVESAVKLEVDTNLSTDNGKSDDHTTSDEEDDNGIQPGPSGLDAKPKNEKK